ncbi:gamma-glutamyl-gamma-aminobutyrate hydrolase family protein [Nocardioides aurantiacus]|uniref:gamma-glutamyl-gamma-aminobutyrate hydrolase family protein n=1 Tax=Nocardioides aurantiacus TaxID=86796 RepID=UPI00403FB026
MRTTTLESDWRSPRIGVSCGNQEQPTAFGSQRTVSLNLRYLQAVAMAGGLPLPLPPSEADPAHLVATVSGIVLTGGGDLDPALYDETAVKQVYGVDGARDAFELSLLEEAEAQRVPVLAICRGMQLVNVSRRGTLIQHVDDEVHWQTADSHEGAHIVRIDPASGLADMVGDGDLLVNSYHHQAIGRLGEGLRVVADANGLPEALETADRLITAVQWHPEQMFEHHPRHLELFVAFVRLATQRAASSPSSNFPPRREAHVR